jgi:hypothetical protein
MEQFIIQFEKKENLLDLKSQVSKDKLILCDDIQNTFIVVKLNNSHNIGIAYYSYGLSLNSFYSQDNTFFYLGFGKTFLCIDIYRSKILYNQKLQSVFYEFLYDSNKGYICLICELDVYCYYKNSLKWKIGFEDILNDYSIIDDTKLSILCNNGEDYLISLKEGNILA